MESSINMFNFHTAVVCSLEIRLSVTKLPVLLFWLFPISIINSISLIFTLASSIIYWVKIFLLAISPTLVHHTVPMCPKCFDLSWGNLSVVLSFLFSNSAGELCVILLRREEKKYMERPTGLQPTHKHTQLQTPHTLETSTATKHYPVMA
jgi:hypothetical protein